MIINAVRALPDDLDPDLVIGPSGTWSLRPGSTTPGRLRILGRRLMEVVAPELADPTRPTSSRGKKPGRRRRPGSR